MVHVNEIYFIFIKVEKRRQILENHLKISKAVEEAINILDKKSQIWSKIRG